VLAAFGLGEFARRRPNTEVVGAVAPRSKPRIAQLDRGRRRRFRAELGITSPALDRMIRAS